MALATVGPARAGVWPTPAAGPSASGGPELVLTFDDGPNRTTERILDTLEAHHAQAIFFLVGRMVERGAPGVVAPILHRMIAGGHVLANHSMTHAQLCTAKAERAAEEIDAAALVLERATGLEMTWFRTPYGSRCARLEAQLAERGLAHFHWDIDPQEWRDHSATRAAAMVLGRLRRATGREVLLMHDIHPVTAKALPLILDGLVAENARRLERGLLPIRIVPPGELAAEQVAPGLLALLADVGHAMTDGLVDATTAIPQPAGDALTAAAGARARRARRCTSP
ncbi:MAG: polysaccharide deacetylase family protein [Kofleriaceae bacterium]